MSMSYNALIARGARDNNRSQLVRLSECGQRLGEEWELPAMTAYLLQLGTGRFAVTTGAGEAATHQGRMLMEHYMKQALRMSGVSRGQGSLQIALKPAGLSRSDWSVKDHALATRNPSSMLIDCAEQLNDAGFNRYGPLIALAKTLSAIGNLRDGGRISAQLEISTTNVVERVFRRDRPLLGSQC